MDIVIVEDTEDSRLLLEDQLTFKGYQVRSASNGVEALALVRQQHPALVVTDILMPEMDGFELCRALKADPDLAPIPVLFYSATYTEQSDIDLALALGGAAFVVKPAPLDEIASAIRSLTQQEQRIDKVLLDDHTYDHAHIQILNRKLNKKLGELEQQKGLFQALLHSTAEGIIGINRDGWPCFVNQAAAQLLGRTEEAILGQDIHRWLHHDAERHASIGECPICRPTLQTGAALHREQDHILRADRSLLPIELWLNPIHGAEGGILTFFDISERRQAEAQSRQLMQEELLQHERLASLGDLVAGFTQELSDPISITRTGLSTVVDMVTHLGGLLELDEVDEEEVLRSLQQMQDVAAITERSMNRAGSMIAGFRRLSIGRTRDQQQHFYIRQVIDDVILSLQHRLHRAVVTVNVQCDATLELYASPGGLGRILINLINNSVEHGFSTTTVAAVITIEVVRRGSRVEIEVVDNGRGMDTTLLRQVFEPFFTTASSQGHSGLGLYVCRLVAEQQLQGTLSCGSAVGVGSHFLLSIPVQ